VPERSARSSTVPSALITASTAVSPSPSPIVGSFCVTASMVMVALSSGSLTPVMPTATIRWLGGQSEATVGRAAEASGGALAFWT